MTQFFEFASLTWPEVEALPRQNPLVLPLGNGYPLHQLAEILGNPPSVGVLPAFPFGWKGSGLMVLEPLLTDYLSNLLQNLRQDGFTRTYILTPDDIDLGFGARQISLGLKRIPDGKLPPRSIPPDNQREKVLLIPVGHTEQHGHHLPLSTDTIIIDAISQGTVQQVAGQAWSLPVMPYGVSTHRDSFPGTFNAGGRVFEDFWVDVIDHLVERGFDRFYFLSGHGGNVSFLVNVVKYCGERHRRIFCATSYLYLSGSEGVQSIQKHRRSASGGMGHACELETSLILHLHPELVHMQRAVDEMGFISTPSYYMDWIEGGALIANPPWDDDTRTGAYGAGSLATAKNGALWLETAVQEKVSHVAEIHEQHLRREERRRSGFGLWGKNRTHQASR